MTIRPIVGVVALALGLAMFAGGWLVGSHSPLGSAPPALAHSSVPTALAPKGPSDPEAIKTAFENVYRNAVWGRDEQGHGTSGHATPVATKLYVTYLQSLVKTEKIKSVVDAGCGEFGQSGLIDWTGIDYKGYDIVADVINSDKKKFEKPNIHFYVANVVDYDLPPADLLICSYVLQHLPIADVTKFLTKQLSKYRHILIVNTVDPKTLTADNRDIEPGGFRFLDITKPPFSIRGTKMLTFLDDPNMQQVLYFNGHP